MTVPPFPDRSRAFPRNTACNRSPVPRSIGNGERGTPLDGTPHGFPSPHEAGRS